MSDVMLAVAKEKRHRAGVRLAMYVAAFVGVPLLAMVVVWVIAGTRWFLWHDDYPGILQSGYGMRLKHADCDVVLYGDSSALTGLRPDVIAQMTGLKTCNISEGGGVDGVVGSRYPLDRYLENNKRPRFLVMMFTPGLYRPYTGPLEEYQPEGMLFALQYDQSHEIREGFLRRWNWVIDFDIWAGHALIADVVDFHLPWGHGKAFVDTRTQREKANGVWSYPLPPETHCVRAALHYNPSLVERYAESVEAMRKLYAVDGTQVIINIAPVPECDARKAVLWEPPDGLHDNAFETLPVSYFNEGDAHFSPEGGRYISMEAARQILALERKDQASAGGASKPAGAVR